MSAGKHTPGNWAVSNGKLLRVHVTDKGGNRVVVCGVHKIGAHGGPKSGDPLANARLIAASPLMFEFVDLIAGFSEPGLDPADDADTLRSLIEKAEALRARVTGGAS